MLENPHITQTQDQLTAIIHLTIPREEIQTVMGATLRELMAGIAAQGVTATGPWFTHHLKMDPDVFDFEISVPVSKAITAAGRVEPGKWPAMKVARTVYCGGYEELGDAWGEFMDWIGANGHSPAADLYECYLAGPESGDDPAGWRTELTRPLKD